MGDEPEPRFHRDIPESPVTVIFEERVSSSDGSNVVVDVAKSRSHADAARQSNSRFLRDILELASAKVFPEFVTTNLV